jgi:hypothetical protein
MLGYATDLVHLNCEEYVGTLMLRIWNICPVGATRHAWKQSEM